MFDQNDNPSEKSQDIISHITSLLIEQCHCKIDMNTAIKNGGFQCFANSPEIVTYRAQIQGTSEVAALDLVQILQQWVSTKPSINIKAQILNVKSSCPVLIASLREEECGSSTITTIITNTPITKTITNATIIIVSLVGITILTLFIMFAVIVYVRIKCRDSLRKNPAGNM